MTAANTPQQINERPKARRRLSNPVVDILCEKIEKVPDLATIASNLKKEFRSLLMNVQDSVKECHLSKVISLIRLHVVECLGPISKSIELYKQKLSSIHTVHEVFAFLIDNHFVGYLNYVLLKEISELVDNFEVKKQFDQYERIYEYLLNASTFNLLMQMFRTYPDLSPTTAIGSIENYNIDNVVMIAQGERLQSSVRHHECCHKISIIVSVMLELKLKELPICRLILTFSNNINFTLDWLTLS